MLRLSFIISSIIGGLLLAQSAVVGLAFADCTIGYNDSGANSGYTLGVGPYEGGLDAAQLVTASCSGDLSQLHWKGWKTGSPSWNPVVKIWSVQNVVSGECPDFGQLVTNFATSDICPDEVIATSNELTGIGGSEFSPQNLTSTFATPVSIVQGTKYFIDVRPPNDTVSTTDFYGMWQAPTYAAQGIKSWKRGTGNGSTAYRWWPDAHNALHIYGTVVTSSSPPPPPPPSPPPTPTVTVTVDEVEYSCEPL